MLLQVTAGVKLVGECVIVGFDVIFVADKFVAGCVFEIPKLPAYDLLFPFVKVFPDPVDQIELAGERNLLPVSFGALGLAVAHGAENNLL